MTTKPKYGLIVLMLAALFTYSGCETDFDVNAKWKDITVVYGLLSQNDTTHYIKINKSFLGEGDANVMAQVQDSSEYKNVSAVIEQWKDDQLMKTLPLNDTLLSNKEPGTFYNPEHTVYYFKEPNIDQDSKYKLNITINESGNDTPKYVSAETEIIDSDQIQEINFPPPSISFAFVIGSNFVDRDFAWPTVKDGLRYNVTFFFTYYEIVQNGNTTDTVEQVIEWVFPVAKAQNVNGGSELKLNMNGEEFYQLLQAKVPELDPQGDIIKRIPKTELVLTDWGVPLNFTISIAGEELNTYIEVNSPSTGIVQEKPEYTNVQNGIGIFSTRYQFKGVRLINTRSVDELVSGNIGGYTTKLGFCHPTNVNHANYCGN